MSEQPAEASPRELIVVVKAGSDIEAALPLSSAEPTADSHILRTILTEYDAEIERLFEQEPGALDQPSSMPEQDMLATFHSVLARDERLDDLAERLMGLDSIESAYVKPGVEPATLNQMMPVPATVQKRITPDFTHRQGYLEAAPGGIGVASAWALTGGKGRNVEVIDIEGAWRFSHEDLLANSSGVIGGTPTSDRKWRNHGTAVLGQIGGDHNGRGVIGIAPEAKLGAVSIFPTGSARAIQIASRRLRPGDVMLVELHREGPAAIGKGQHGYIAVEWWPDDFVALQAASRRGVIVIEAVGNGAQDLDDPIYDSNPGGFPSWWKNPFRRDPLDSGAILVGAGAPPPGTHGQHHGPDRSRLSFSNYGSAVDTQGWGREVTTCGYGDLQGGPNEDRWYTDSFAGTSSASPIIAGAVTSLQGIAKQRGSLLKPQQIRDLLRNTGSPQQHAPGRPVTQRIGNRPDLSQLRQSLFTS